MCTPLQKLIANAERGKTEMVRHLLEEENAPVDCKDNDGWTPLMHASAWGRSGTARLLLEKRASINFRLRNGRTALMIAVSNGKKSMVDLLLQYGADTSIRCNKRGLTAAEMAGNLKYGEIERKIHSWKLKTHSEIKRDPAPSAPHKDERKRMTGSGKSKSRPLPFGSLLDPPGSAVDHAPSAPPRLKEDYEKENKYTAQSIPGWIQPHLPAEARKPLPFRPHINLSRFERGSRGDHTPSRFRVDLGAMSRKAERPPDNFVCPISGEVMVDPVITVAGFTYERKEISAWFARGKCTDPMTNESLDSTDLIPNRALKSQIREWMGKRLPVAYTCV